MTADRPDLLAKAVYHAPVPAMVIDDEGRVIDYNVALEALIGDRLNGCRERPLVEVIDALPPPTEGPIFPESPRIPGGPRAGHRLIDMGSSEFTFDSGAFGRARIACAPLDCRINRGASPAWTLILWDVVEIDREDALFDRFRELLDRQLTWESYARSYDRILTLMPYYQEVVARHRSALRDSGAGPVIDLGAGTGNLVAQLVGAGVEVVAVDSSRAMLDRLRAKFRDHSGPGLKVIEASAERLPGLADASFSGASILLALFDMERPFDALEEAIRLLRPGGTLVLTEPKLGFDIEPILGACKRRLDDLGRADELAEDLARVNEVNRSKINPAARTTHVELHAESIFEHLGRRGFEGLSISDSHFGQCATIRGLKR